jgi:hypothetical protein
MPLLTGNFDMQKLLVAFSIFLSLAATACSPSEADLATVNVQTQEVKNASATEVAGTQAVIKSTQDTQSTSIARTATYEFEQIAAETQAHESTATSAAENTATEEATLFATAQAASMYDQVSDLAAQGYISRIEGTYHTIKDFNETWAQIDWCQYWYPGYSPKDFVLRADASMDSAANYADSHSGCAIVFREDGAENNYMLGVNMYGYVFLRRVYNGNLSDLGGESYGIQSVRTEELQFMLAVEGDMITAFVDGEHVLTRRDSVLTSGNLALSLFSGTNQDFGAKCQLTNIELWILE